VYKKRHVVQVFFIMEKRRNRLIHEAYCFTTKMYPKNHSGIVLNIKKRRTKKVFEELKEDKPNEHLLHCTFTTR